MLRNKVICENNSFSNGNRHKSMQKVFMFGVTAIIMLVSNDFIFLFSINSTSKLYWNQLVFQCSCFPSYDKTVKFIAVKGGLI